MKQYYKVDLSNNINISKINVCEERENTVIIIYDEYGRKQRALSGKGYSNEKLIMYFKTLTELCEYLIELETQNDKRL